MKTILLIAIFATMCFDVEAELKEVDPEIVCNLLADDGLEMNSFGWRKHTMGCMTNIKRFTSNEMKMALTYTVRGHEHNNKNVRLNLIGAASVKLTLNAFVKKGNEGSVNYDELVNKTIKISGVLAGQVLPDEVIASIRKGEAIEVNLNGTIITVSERIWRSDEIYELQVVFK